VCRTVHTGSSHAEVLSVRASNPMAGIVRKLWHENGGQDVAEYAVMLAVVLVIVMGTIRLIGLNSSNVFSSVGSSMGGL